MKDLLDAIAANPADDAPRRVYADALLERGDPHGELINVQLDLTRTDLPLDERIRRRRRERALFREHLARWIAPLDGLATDPIVRRGFVEEAKVRVRVLTRRGDELRAAAPFLRAVTIGDISAGAEDLVDFQLRRFETALRAPIVAELEGLRFHPEYTMTLSNAPFPPSAPMRDAIHLFRAAIPWLTRLVALAPVECWRDGYEPLVETGLLERLRFLDLVGGTAEAARVMLDACTALRGLRLGTPWETDDGPLSTDARLAGLVELSVHLSSQTGLRTLLEKPELARLVDLDLRETEWDTFQALRDVRGLPALRVLRYHWSRASQFNIAALLEWPIVKQLDLLDLRGVIDAHRHRLELERRFDGVLVTSKPYSWDATRAGLGECW